VAHVVGVVRAEEDRIDLERDLRRVDVLGEVAFVDGEAYRLLDRADPLVHRLLDGVAHRAVAAVELERGGGEEAAARKDVALDVVEPRAADGDEARVAALGVERRLEHLARETLARDLDGRELQLFLRAEVREEAALRHLQLLGETADGQPFEPLGGRQIGGALEDRAARPESLHA
jgi:hypothetical protein